MIQNCLIGNLVIDVIVCKLSLYCQANERVKHLSPLIMALECLPESFLTVVVVLVNIGVQEKNSVLIWYSIHLVATEAQ